MFYEGYVSRYLFEEQGWVTGISEPEYRGKFSNYNAATKWFAEIMENHDGLARWFVKVYDSEVPEGEILCACSMEWGDNIFNDGAF